MKNSKIFYAFIILVSLAVIITHFLDDEDFVYYYLRIVQGNHFDTQEKSYKLNDGFYFSGKKTERGTFVVRYRGFPNTPIVISTGVSMNFPELVEKGIFAVYSKASRCVFFSSVENPKDLFATIENDFSVNVELEHDDNFDVDIVCNMVSQI